MRELNQISEEIAQEEFERILKAARVKWAVYERVNGKRDCDAEKAVYIDALMDGRITVNDEGFPTVIIEDEDSRIEEISFKRRPVSGDMLMADRAGGDAKKTFLTLGKFLGIAPAELERLDAIDLNLVLNLWNLFLGY